jgi:hypothetical protein
MKGDELKVTILDDYEIISKGVNRFIKYSEGESSLIYESDPRPCTGGLTPCGVMLNLVKNPDKTLTFLGETMGAVTINPVKIKKPTLAMIFGSCTPVETPK